MSEKNNIFINQNDYISSSCPTQKRNNLAAKKSDGQNTQTDNSFLCPSDAFFKFSKNLRRSLSYNIKNVSLVPRLRPKKSEVLPTPLSLNEFSRPSNFLEAANSAGEEEPKSEEFTGEEGKSEESGESCEEDRNFMGYAGENFVREEGFGNSYGNNSNNIGKDSKSYIRGGELEDVFEAENEDDGFGGRRGSGINKYVCGLDSTPKKVDSIGYAKNSEYRMLLKSAEKSNETPLTSKYKICDIGKESESKKNSSAKKNSVGFNFPYPSPDSPKSSCESNENFCCRKILFQEKEKEKDSFYGEKNCGCIRNGSGIFGGEKNGGFNCNFSGSNINSSGWGRSSNFRKDKKMLTPVANYKDKFGGFFRTLKDEEKEHRKFSSNIGFAGIGLKFSLKFFRHRMKSVKKSFSNSISYFKEEEPCLSRKIREDFPVRGKDHTFSRSINCFKGNKKGLSILDILGGKNKINDDDEKCKNDNCINNSNSNSNN